MAESEREALYFIDNKWEQGKVGEIRPHSAFKKLYTEMEANFVLVVNQNVSYYSLQIIISRG